MWFCMKILGLVLGIYICGRMSGIGIAWLKEFFDAISPKKNDY